MDISFDKDLGFKFKFILGSCTSEGKVLSNKEWKLHIEGKVLPNKGYSVSKGIRAWDIYLRIKKYLSLYHNSCWCKLNYSSLLKLDDSNLQSSSFCPFKFLL